jgi:two-component SAPR family response regulator
MNSQHREINTWDAMDLNRAEQETKKHKSMLDAFLHQLQAILARPRLFRQ